MLSLIFRCCICSILLLGLSQGSPVSIAEHHVQQSENTIRQAKSEGIRKYMNESADPCEDFYEYTCGNYDKYNAVDEYNVQSIIYNKMENAMNDKLMTELEVDDAADTDMDKQMKIFYRSCVDTQQHRPAYIESIKEAAKEFGGMPAMLGDSWQENEFDWAKTIKDIFQKTNFGIIFEGSVATDLEDSSKKRAMIHQPTFEFNDRFFYTDETMAPKRRNFLFQMQYHMTTYLDVEEVLAFETAFELLKFETALVLGTADRKQQLPFTALYPLTNIDELHRKTWPTWDVKKFISDIWGPAVTEVRVATNYVETAVNVIKSTPKRVLANYIMYQYLTQFTLGKLGPESKLKKHCLQTTNKYLYKNLLNSFYRKYSSEQAREGIYTMWQEIKRTFERVLKSPKLNWIQEDTQRQALEKLKAMKIKIHNYEDTDFAREYGELNLKTGNYVDNLKAVMLAGAKIEQRKLNGPLEVQSSGLRAIFSPVYAPSENVVYIPVAVLQPEYIWSLSYPQAFNFANLGYLVSHELVHGFDDTGGRYDAKGNERNWWDSQTSSTFMEHTKCFADQYHKYIFRGKSLPYTKVQTENIADNGGIGLAYEAYQRWYRKTYGDLENMDIFPGLNYTSNELFFISYGHHWCAKYHSSYLDVIANVDTHMPPKFRVIGALANSEEFAKAFNCPAGSLMNPVKKCEIY